MIKNLIFTLTLLASATSFANMKSFSFMEGNEIQGQETFRIHQKINQRLQAQGLNPDNYQLEGVRLYAKSLAGHATASLVVGPDTDTKRIPKAKNPAMFLLDAPFSFHILEWDLRGQQGQKDEHWQMRFNGFIKVDAMDVFVSSRGRRIRIPMGGEMFMQNSTIYVRQRLRQMGINTQGKKLRKLTLVAKSKKGRGSAYLQIGNKTKPMKTVDKDHSGWGFQSERPVSYNRVEWRAKGPTQGVWQVHMRGRIKVKAIIVELR